jgi:hypothetical protein
VRDDDAPTETGDERDAPLYRVDFDDKEAAEFRWQGLRPSITE